MGAPSVQGQGGVEGEEDAAALAEQQRDLWDTLAVIRPNLFLATCKHEQGLPLQDRGVTHVLQVGKGLKPSRPEAHTYLSLRINDDEEADLVAVLPQALAFIQEAHDQQGTVLVHCFAGVSRSASVVTAWLMHKERLGVDEALASVKATRRPANPNPGFMMQLREWQAMGCDLSGSRWKGWSREAFLERASDAERMLLERRLELAGSK